MYSVTKYNVLPVFTSLSLKRRFAQVARFDRSCHYETLGLADDASALQIKGKYYELSKKYHPDVNKNDELAAIKFAAIAEAYSVVGNIDSRRLYDKTRKYTLTATHANNMPTAFDENYTRHKEDRFNHQNMTRSSRTTLFNKAMTARGASAFSNNGTNSGGTKQRTFDQMYKNRYSVYKYNNMSERQENLHIRILSRIMLFTLVFGAGQFMFDQIS